MLFGGANLLQDALVTAMEESPASAPPLDQVAAGLAAAGDVFLDPDYSRQRQGIIAAHAELRERELIKLASLSAACAECLRQRGVAEPAATLSADAGVAVFKVAFERWIEPGNQRPFAELVFDSIAELKAVAAS